MKNKNEKKGLFQRLLGSKKAKEGSCCCGNFEIEDLPEEQGNNSDEKKPKTKLLPTKVGRLNLGNY